VSALNSFDFLNKDENEEPVTNTIQPQQPHWYILPKQWRRVHRALFHHLCNLFDLVDAFPKHQGPLDALQKKSRDLMLRNLETVHELMSLITKPDEIILRDSKFIYVYRRRISSSVKFLRFHHYIVAIR